MKQVLKFCVLLIVLGGVYWYRVPLATFLTTHIITEKKVNDPIAYNSYFGKNNYQFVQITEDFTPKNKQDLMNILYTVLNAGMTDFTFYCSEEYEDCIQDVDNLSNDPILLSNINNFISPYNSFQNMETTRYDSTGKVNLKIYTMYTEGMIEKINSKIEEIVQEKIKDEMSDEEKIKVIHDYIIDNTKYDSKKSDENISAYQSNTAYGPLFEGYGLCSGYADAMKLFLDYLKIPSIKISSENHIWNLVYLDGKWLHLDLTWDDPVLDTGKEIIDYEYYLITTEELYSKDDKQHFFDETIYKEAL